MAASSLAAGRLAVSDILASLGRSDRQGATAVLMSGAMVQMSAGQAGPLYTGSAGLAIVKYGELEVVATTGDGRDLLLMHADDGDVLTCPPAGLAAGGVIVRALRDSHVCPIDHEQLRDLAPYPQVLAALVSQCVQRIEESQAAALRLAHRRVDDRVVLALRALAVRSGRVTGQGVRVPSVRHRELARLASVTRPGATQALARLQARGLLRREPDGCLLLLGSSVLPATCRLPPPVAQRPGGQSRATSST